VETRWIVGIVIAKGAAQTPAACPLALQRRRQRRKPHENVRMLHRESTDVARASSTAGQREEALRH
jgi:hypothetical protein